MVDKLGRMEHEAVRCTQEGMTNTEIGARLGVTRQTVKSYLGRAYSKLGLTGGEGARTKAAVMVWCHDHETHSARLLRTEDR